MFQCRDITPADAVDFTELLRVFARETPFMLQNEAEHLATADTQQARIEQIVAAPGQQLIVVTDTDDPDCAETTPLIGFVAISQGAFEKNRHIGSLMIGVLPAYQGRGVGSLLMQRALDWCDLRGITRVELTVMADNNRAIDLYRRFGFEQEGIRRQAMRCGDTLADELYMARLCREQ